MTPFKRTHFNLLFSAAVTALLVACGSDDSTLNTSSSTGSPVNPQGDNIAQCNEQSWFGGVTEICNGVLVYRDELHGLLCSMDTQGQEGARGFYLTGYDGNQGHAVDRIGRGESFVPRVCLAMLGGIQPGKVQSYVRDAVAGGAGDDGLLQRFGLTVWPDVHREFVYVDRWPDTPAKQAAWAVFERLNQLQPATDSDAQEWRFTPDAQALFDSCAPVWKSGFPTAGWWSACHAHALREWPASVPGKIHQGEQGQTTVAQAL